LRTNSFKVAIILLATSLVSACGYQLKGSHTSKLDNVQIHLASSNPFGKFEKVLTRRLNFSGANTVELVGANYTIEIVSIESREKGVSRDATGRANEAILTTTLRFQLVDAKPDSSESDGDITLQVLEESASYAFDYRDPVARKNQQKETLKWLHQNLADRLIRRLERQISGL